jgi:formylglycine-generating enzyme required for sulfatase activity
MKTLAQLCVLICVAVSCRAADRLPIGPGDFISVLPSGTAAQTIHVAAFELDRRPVTNASFLAFVVSHPQWRRDRVAALFADGDYLSHWASADRLGPSVLPDQPVTRVSWYAARAYCAAAGGQLPSWNQWEYAAAADESRPDARRDPAWQAKILAWYARPANRALARVGLGRPNYYGVQDLHGLVWEWVEDFNALMISGDSRDQGDPDKLKFCGAGTLSLQDKEDYAVLMRIALLSALEARSTTRSLGFRCAAEGGSP